jgi:hypothetical protein
MPLLGALLILVFGFLFSVVSSRITGEVGSTSCPLSGMTIAVLMGTCGVFILAAGRLGARAARADDRRDRLHRDQQRRDLLAGPEDRLSGRFHASRQQGALLIGVLASVLAVGWTAYGLNLVETREAAVEKPFAVDRSRIERADAVTSRSEQLTFEQGTRKEPASSYRFVALGTKELPAGQAAGNYLVDEKTGRPAISVRTASARAAAGAAGHPHGHGHQGHPRPRPALEPRADRRRDRAVHRAHGFRSLTFAVGVYLPLSSTMPVFLGGLIRKLADRRYGREADAEDEPEGTLWCSGLIAGASIFGILAALQGFLKGFDPGSGLHPLLAVLKDTWLSSSNAFGALVLAALGFLMFRGAAPRRRPTPVGAQRRHGPSAAGGDTDPIPGAPNRRSPGLAAPRAAGPESRVRLSPAIAMHPIPLALSLLLLGASLSSQNFVTNGDFSGGLTGWTLGGGYSCTPGLETFDVGGLGPVQCFGCGPGGS